MPSVLKKQIETDPWLLAFVVTVQRGGKRRVSFSIYGVDRKPGVRSLVRLREKERKEGRKRKPPRRHTFSTIVNKGRRERDDSLKRNLRGKQDSRFIVRATRNRPQRYLHAHAPCAWRNSFLGPRSFFNKRGRNRSGRAKVEHR